MFGWAGQHRLTDVRITFSLGLCRKPIAEGSECQTSEVGEISPRLSEVSPLVVCSHPSVTMPAFTGDLSHDPHSFSGVPHACLSTPSPLAQILVCRSGRRLFSLGPLLTGGQLGPFLSGLADGPKPEDRNVRLPGSAKLILDLR